MCRSQWPRGLRRGYSGISGSKPPRGMNICLLSVLCVVRYSSLWRTILLPQKFYRLWCVILCALETSRMRRPWPALGCWASGKIVNAHRNTYIYDYSNYHFVIFYSVLISYIRHFSAGLNICIIKIDDTSRMLICK